MQCGAPCTAWLRTRLHPLIRRRYAPRLPALWRGPPPLRTTPRPWRPPAGATWRSHPTGNGVAPTPEVRQTLTDSRVGGRAWADPADGCPHPPLAPSLLWGRGGRAGTTADTTTTCALHEAWDPTCLAAGTDAAPPPCQRNGGKSEPVSSQGRRGRAAPGGGVRGDRWATGGLEGAPVGTELPQEKRVGTTEKQQLELLR